MSDDVTRGDRPRLLAWRTPHLQTLDIGGTLAGPSPNIQETVLTDPSFAPNS